jgi:hypothetical protein
VNVGSRESSLPPALIRGLLDDPSVFRGLIERHAPYAPVQRYFSGNAAYRASSAQGQKMIIAPNFRGDWAYEKPLVEGAEIFFDHPGLIASAKEMFDTECVRPLAVYTNLTWQLPFSQGGGHTDVPAFRGIDRKQYPIWFLSTMGHSGLFEAERINIATAVAWFYRGEDGGFEYWPETPHRTSLVHEGDIFNTAIVGDNDRMYHRVRPVGRREDGLVSGMTLESRLEHAGGDAWRIVDAGRVLAEFEYDALRISVSWKAEVFSDAEERRTVDEHLHDLSLEDVVGRFCADLEDRKISADRPTDPLVDEAFIDLLTDTYVELPDTSA